MLFLIQLENQLRLSLNFDRNIDKEMEKQSPMLSMYSENLQVQGLNLGNGI